MTVIESWTGYKSLRTLVFSLSFLVLSNFLIRLATGEWRPVPRSVRYAVAALYTVIRNKLSKFLDHGNRATVPMVQKLA